MAGERVNNLVSEVVLHLDTQNFEDCIGHIAQNILNAAKAKTCNIYLADNHTNKLYLCASVGQSVLPGHHSIDFGIGVVGEVGKTRKPICRMDIIQSEGVAEGAQDSGAYHKESVIAVPMIALGKFIGVLEVRNKDNGEFTIDDLRILQPLVNIAAMAIPKEYDDSFMKLAEICIRFLEEKDPYTHGHSQRVMKYSLAIAEEIMLPLKDMEKLKVSSLLHDIGKVVIKDSILRKQGKLTGIEYQMIKMHPQIGGNITKKISTDLSANIAHHHERWDGNGYPSGYKEGEIPLLSRIIAIADTFDAITSRRSYREAQAAEIAMKEIIRFRNLQFDPTVVDAAIAAYRKQRLDVLAQND